MRTGSMTRMKSPRCMQCSSHVCVRDEKTCDSLCRLSSITNKDLKIKHRYGNLWIYLKYNSEKFKSKIRMMMRISHTDIESDRIKGRIYCLCSVLIYGAETWAMKHDQKLCISIRTYDR